MSKGDFRIIHSDEVDPAWNFADFAITRSFLFEADPEWEQRIHDLLQESGWTATISWNKVYARRRLHWLVRRVGIRSRIAHRVAIKLEVPLR